MLESSIWPPLVNPYFIRQIPGKKSVVKDAGRIATCLLDNVIESRIEIGRTEK